VWEEEKKQKGNGKKCAEGEPRRHRDFGHKHAQTPESETRREDMRAYWTVRDVAKTGSLRWGFTAADAGEKKKNSSSTR